MKRFHWLLFLLFPLLWALTLAGGLLVYVVNQQPTTLARVLTERLSDPQQGLALSAQGATLSLFPLPCARLSEVVVSTPDAALFVKDCAVFPDAWALLRGTFAVRAVRLDEASLLVRQTPSAAAPKPFPLPSFTLPPALAGTDITLKNGLFALLRPGQSPVAIRPVLLFSGLSGSGTLPDYEAEGETLSGGSLHLAASSLSAAAETEEGAARRQVDDVRLEIKDIAYTPPRPDAPASLRLRAELSLPVPLGGTPPHAMLAAEVKTEKGRLAVEGAAALDGTLTFPKQAFPVHALVPYEAFFPVDADGALHLVPEVAFKGAALRADKDAASFSGLLTFPSEEKGSSPLLKGTLTVKNLSLPRWFDFARDLPSGVTAALDGLSGTLPFELTPRSLTIAAARVTALDTPFTGGGGVKDFRHPVITVTLGTPTADLNRLFPELTGKAVTAPIYAMPPLLGGDDDPGSPAPGYDVHLTAARATCAYWEGKDVSLRITPEAAHADASARLAIRCGSLYGGSAEAELIPGDELAIVLSASGVNAETFLKPVKGSPPLRGTLAASASVTARPSSLAAFLASLRGNASLTLDKGVLPLSPDGKERFAFSRLHLAFQGAGSRDAKALRYVYDGQWRAEAVTPDGQGSLSFTGPLSFSATGPFSVRGQALSTSATATAKGYTAQAAGTLSFDTATETLSAQNVAGNLGSKGAAATFGGSLRHSRKEGRSIWEAPISLSSANLRPLLADLLPGDLPKQALKRADLKATITLDGETLRIAGLNGNIDATRLSGQMERRAGTPARWTFGLRLGTLNVADYLPPTSKGGKSQPWRLDWMKGIDVEGPLAAERLIIFGIPHTDFSAPLRLQNGVLSADPIRARVAGGSAGAGVRAEATSGGLLGRLRYTLENVNALTLSKERGQSQLLSGTGSLDADVSGLLRSGADIPAALTGTLGFTLRNGELDAGHPGTFSSFRSLGATGTLSKGILTTRDLHLDGTLTVRGYGTINLLNWTLDYRLNVSGPGFPTLPVRYYGSLDKPQRSINAQGFLAKTFGSLGNGFLTILDRVVFAPLRFLVP